MDRLNTDPNTGPNAGQPTVRSITLAHEIWVRLARLYRSIDGLDEQRGQVIHVTRDDHDQLVAVLSTDQMDIAVYLDPSEDHDFVDPDDDAFGCVFPISFRTVAFADGVGRNGEAYTMFLDSNGTSSITIDDTTYSVDVPDTDGALCPDGPILFPPSATVVAGRLDNALTAAHHCASGVDRDWAAEQPYWFSVTADHRLAITRDWSERQSGMSTVHLPVELDDPRQVGQQFAVAAVDHLVEVMRLVQSPAEEISIRLPEEVGQPLLVGGAHWSASIPVLPSPIVGTVDRIEQSLADAGWYIERVDPRAVVIGHHPTMIRIDAYDDGEPGVRLRCSLVLVRDVVPAPELLAELNDLNRGINDAKLWYDEGRIVIGQDTWATDLPGLSAVLRNLTHHAVGLGPALGSLAGMATAET